MALKKPLVSGEVLQTHGLLAGVGGVNVPPDRIVEFVRQARAAGPQPESVWVR
jgi:hypothetical protein